MATLLSHPLIPVACWIGLGSERVSRRLVLVAVVASLVPDIDVIGFFVGVPYGHPLGHRGFSHSLLFALLLAGTVAQAAEWLRTSKSMAFWTLFGSTASHGVLDALTDGGMGIGFLIPFSTERFFFPWSPIQVSPIGVRNFFDSHFLQILGNELLWIWLPALAVGGGIGLWRRRSERSGLSSSTES